MSLVEGSKGLLGLWGFFLRRFKSKTRMLRMGPRLSNPITQDECLYDDLWSKKADSTFIDVLVELNLLGDWKVGRPSPSIFNYTRLVLIAEHEAYFNLQELGERFEFLHKRYSVFSWMLHKHGLRHCFQSNILTAPVAIWDDKFESNPFSVAYQHSGDPRWGDLRFIGDTQDVVQDRNSTNVVAGAHKDTSHHTALQHLCSTRNSIFPPHHTRPSDASSEESVNTQSMLEEYAQLKF
ncbi:pentatricopeptide repeat (PPR) superfamily protein [Striga asiatica]|uniref:Pentatricopeptide repeat (PPR) superfamily protein n=1 Tax=Striga asiatica TaxID=4170 RepID=A0A5A7QQ90_STRAF|nr:pentatricopeptide repeat (PPR) superfamily protein [Striga asiatica]